MTGRHRALTALYAGTIFVSAFLIFWVEPMFTKAVLPLLGGSPAVWNTALVFFQGTLLAGYLYAHALSDRLRAGGQVAVHLGLLALAFLVLPVAVPGGWEPPAGAVPSFWLLGLFAVAMGLPFFVLSATAPLLQRWFSVLDHPAAGDPYHLYAASNLGSLGALLAFPLLLEPRLTLDHQSRLWAWIYAAVGLLLAVCGATVWAWGRGPNPEAEPPRGGVEVSWRRKARWALLAFAPSSLLLAVTGYLTTDVAAVPLLWVVPLALYLLTFVLAFSRREWIPHRWVLRGVPIVVLLLVLDLISPLAQENKLAVMLPFHLVAFFILALACHGELARDRPEPGHLTRFYVWLSAGGVTGGAFNALVAPLVFDRLTEYPLVLILACALLPNWKGQAERVVRADLALPSLLAAVGLAPALGLGSVTSYRSLEFLAFYGVAGLWTFTFRKRSLRFALGVAALLFASTTLTQGEEVLLRERSFFGTLEVTRPEEGVHLLRHGTTTHGSQRVTPGDRTVPQSYYARPGPVGQMFEALRSQGDGLRVGVVGLGTGSMACYRTPRDEWRFFEVDPVVARVARDTSYFHYLAECAPDSRVVIGDGRRGLSREPPGSFDLLILDAFSSDAIPVHLLTREAVELYLSRLDPDGVLALHISNRYLDLRPVTAAVAEELGLVLRSQVYHVPDSLENGRGKLWTTARWAVMARKWSDLGSLATDGRWRGPVEDRLLWTDSYSNIVALLRW